MFDSHVHLDYENFYSELDAVASRMGDVGVTGAMNPSVDLASSRRCLAINSRFPWVLPALGIHPLYVGRYEKFPETELRELAATGAFRAVGEIGLDFWEGRGEEEKQREFFEGQLKLAGEFRLPLLIHVRKAFYDVLTMIRKSGFSGSGVLHAFSGSRDMAVKALDLGFHLSASAVLTRPGKEGLREVFRLAPRDRILVETDAPDLPPWERRGQTHYPWDLPKVLETLGDAMGLPAEEAASITTANAENLFLGGI